MSLRTGPNVLVFRGRTLCVGRCEAVRGGVGQGKGPGSGVTVICWVCVLAEQGHRADLSAVLLRFPKRQKCIKDVAIGKEPALFKKRSGLVHQGVINCEGFTFVNQTDVCPICNCPMRVKSAAPVRRGLGKIEQISVADRQYCPVRQLYTRLRHEPRSGKVKKARVCKDDAVWQDCTLGITRVAAMNIQDNYHRPDESRKETNKPRKQLSHTKVQPPYMLCSALSEICPVRRPTQVS